MARLVAHRGQNYTIPENTIESIKAAISCGATAVEFDVQITKDGVPVISHDVSLLATADVDVILTDVNYSELKDINVNQMARFGTQYQNISLPTLDDMVSLLINETQVLVFIELKDESIDAFGMDAFLEAVISQVEPIKHHSALIADNLQALVKSKTMANMPIGWIIHQWDTDFLKQAKTNKVDYMVINHDYCEGHQHDYEMDDWQWVVYETRDADTASALFNQGVSFVETDDICSMLKQLPNCQ